jgi:pyruvate formate lyase activating enzyme
MKEASFYKRLEEKRVQCNLCPHNCKINKGKTGFCKVRKNIDGILYSLVYGSPISCNLDPIEKKPLFHFYPGSKAYSIATVGCNMRCKHCQNADISQVKQCISPSYEISAEEIVKQAKNCNAGSIAYTYTEPTIFYEYALDIAKLAHKNGLKNVFVTNGYISKEPLEEIAPYIDGVNIDLKGINERFYSDICSAHLQPVLDTINIYVNLDIWIEITTLIIPDYNDDEKELKKIATFIYDINPCIPWHVTGFYPTYKLINSIPTPLSTLEKAASIGKETGLDYIYLGNRNSGEDTYCPNCQKLLIKRSGFNIHHNYIDSGKCIFCHNQISGLGFK